MKKRTIEIWSLSRLKRNEEQGLTICDLNDEELNSLVDDIRKNGQLTPIEVAPDGVILDGHQRKRALEQLGRKARVWVRHDLVGQGQGALDKRYCEANLNRRHLDALGKLRVVKRLAELELGDLANPASGSHDEVKEQTAKRMNMSSRNLNRYLRVVATPIDLQQAFASGKIGLVDAGKVADLAPETQAEIAVQIASGDDPKTVVSAALRNGSPRNGPSAAEVVRGLLRSLQKAEDYFAGGRIENVPGGMGNRIPSLQAGQATIQRIIDELSSGPDTMSD